MSPPVILVVEKNDKVRDAVGKWASCMFPEGEVVHARSGQEAVRYAGTLSPTIALLGVGLDDMSAGVTKLFIEALSPSTEVILFSPEPESELVSQPFSGSRTSAELEFVPHIPSAKDVSLN